MNKYVFFDNYFTSVRLLEFLQLRKVFACGTVRGNRKGLPSNMKSDKKMKRGEFDSRTTMNGVTFFKWIDKKPILLACNFHGTEKTIQMFITPEIVEEIVQWTNIVIANRQSILLATTDEAQRKVTSSNEISALIGLLVLTAVKKD